MKPNKLTPLILFVLSFLQFACSEKGKSRANDQNSTTAVDEIEYWITKADQSVLLQKGSSPASFNSVSNSNFFIDVDSSAVFQTVDGFGHTLTGGSPSLISKMNAAERSDLLNELFGKGDNSIKISYLRSSIGASDLNASVFSYDDMP